MKITASNIGEMQCAKEFNEHKARVNSLNYSQCLYLLFLGQFSIETVTELSPFAVSNSPFNLHLIITLFSAKIK